MGKITKPRINAIATNPRNAEVRRNFTVTSDHVFFELYGSRKNVVNNFMEFNRLALSERERDLLNISVAVFMADISVRKDKFTGQRKIDLLVPVSNSRFWDSKANQISAICSFLDRNPFQIHFLEQEEEVPSGLESPELEPEAVCCFSGGLDSLAGAHDLIESGKSILLSTVIHSRVIAGIANSAYHALEEYHGEVNRVVYNASTRKRNRAHQFVKMTESSMHCRSFLYLASAAAIANHFGATEVVIPENGIFALNVSLNRGRLSTRTVHPIFLREMRKLLQSVLSPSLRIVNPFERITKGEVVAKLADIPNSIPNAVSCAHAWRAPMIGGALSKPKSRHCGYCYPCLARRASLISAGLDNSDSAYVIDIFNDLFPRINTRKEFRDASVAVLELLKFAHDIRHLNVHEIGSRYPEFEEIPHDYPFYEAVELYKRFSEEIRIAFADTSSSTMKNSIRPYLA